MTQIELLRTLFLAIMLGPLLLSGQEKNDLRGFRKSNNGIYVIAHRGAHVGIPENSLPAYQKAIDLGCDFVEIDVRTTKDGKFVSIHNSTVDNYVNGKTGSVRNMTLAQLKLLDIGDRFGEVWKNTRIPTFEEILQMCRGKIGIYLDLKDASVPELMKSIRKYEMENDVIWYIPYSYFVKIENVEETFGKSYPMPDPKNESNLTALLEKFKLAAVATDMGVLTENFVTRAHSHGTKVFADEKEGTLAE